MEQNPEVEDRKRQIMAIQLTDEELTKAIIRAKTIKWHNLKNFEYWQEKENKKKDLK